MPFAVCYAPKYFHKASFCGSRDRLFDTIYFPRTLLTPLFGFKPNKIRSFLLSKQGSFTGSRFPYSEPGDRRPLSERSFIYVSPPQRENSLLSPQPRHIYRKESQQVSPPQEPIIGQGDKKLLPTKINWLWVKTPRRPGEHPI